jgi:hypothetical protein
MHERMLLRIDTRSRDFVKFFHLTPPGEWQQESQAARVSPSTPEKFKKTKRLTEPCQADILYTGRFNEV